MTYVEMNVTFVCTLDPSCCNGSCALVVGVYCDCYPTTDIRLEINHARYQDTESDRSKAESRVSESRYEVKAIHLKK